MTRGAPSRVKHGPCTATKLHCIVAAAAKLRRGLELARVCTTLGGESTSDWRTYSVVCLRVLTGHVSWIPGN